MKKLYTLFILLVVSLPSIAQDEHLAFDLDFINNDSKKLFRMDNYYSRKTSRNGSVRPRKHRVIIFDPVTEQHQEINVKNIYSEMTYKMQDAITAIDEDGREHRLTTDSIAGFVTKHVCFLNKTFTFKGKTMTKFLQREDVYLNEDIHIYSYEEEPSLKDYFFVDFADGNGLLPLTDDTPESIGHIKNIFLNDSNATDRLTQKMIEDMKPTPSSIRKVHRALRAGGYGHLQRFRWGIAAVAGISMLHADGYSFTAKPLKSIGVTAEMPIASMVSFVPELYFMKTSAKGTLTTNASFPSCAVYNRTEVCLPMMIRYTLFNMHGHFLPYAQAGIAPSIGVKQNFDYRQVSEKYKSAFERVGYVTEGSEKLSTLQAKGIAGVGTEWIGGYKYSVFCELRGAFRLRNLSSNDIMLVVGLRL